MKRHLYDLETGAERGLWFDTASAEYIIDFFSFCKHSEGEWAGTVIELEPWQQFILAVVFGWKKEDGYRRFRTVYEEIARKNGKSIKLAGIGNYLTGYDGEQGAQTYSCGTKREQARAIHKPAIRMVKASPALRRRLNTLRDNINCLETNSKFEPLGRDSKTEDGLNVHGSLIDEYHAHPDSGMYDVLRSGMGSRKQPITYVITTAGFEKTCPCYEMRGDICTILENYDDQNINDDSVFGIIYTIDDDDDWMDESCWVKANPNLNVSVYLEDMRIMFATAKRVPSKQNEFKTKKLNIWTESETLWITSNAWALNSHPVDQAGLLGRQCYGGLDLSSVNDITAWVKCFPPLTAEDRYKFLYHFFIPQAELYERVRKDKVPYDVWINQGFVTATPGGSVDYDYIIDQIRRDSELYMLDQILYDPWNASYVTTILEADNFPLVTFTQSMGSFNAASKDFEKRVLDGSIAHGNNPVMNWMVGCTSVKQDSAGNTRPVKPDRGSTNKRIDGVVASIMALDGAVRNCGITESVYATRGLLTLDISDEDEF